MGWGLPNRLLVDLGGDSLAEVLSWPDGGLPELVARGPLTWPLTPDALEDLRWYLEDYLLAPFGVWEDRGPAVREKLAGWGEQVFESVFGPGPARDAYQRARDRGLEVVFRPADPGLLALPWELMRDGAGPVALGADGISRSLPVADGAGTLEVPGGRLRVLMVMSRPAGTQDVGYQMVARPLLQRLDAVRGADRAAPVRPDEAGHLAGTDRERHPVQRLHRAEPLAQSVDLDSRVHGNEGAAGWGVRRIGPRAHLLCRRSPESVCPQADDMARQGGYDPCREHGPGGPEVPRCSCGDSRRSSAPCWLPLSSGLLT